MTKCVNYDTHDADEEAEYVCSFGEMVEEIVKKQAEFLTLYPDKASRKAAGIKPIKDSFESPQMLNYYCTAIESH